MHAYCVILRPRQASNNLYPQTKRYYLNARSASQAMLIASEDPEWLVCGVEPAAMSAVPVQSVRSLSTDNLFAAQGARRNIFVPQ
jgi:hypothetical protein